MKRQINIYRYITLRVFLYYLYSLVRTSRLKLFLDRGVSYKVKSLAKLGGLVKISRFSKIEFRKGVLTFKGSNVIGDFSKIYCDNPNGFLIMGEGVTANSFCHFGCNGGVEIGADTILGEYVSIHSENHVFSKSMPIKTQGVTNEGIKIGEGCWVGAKATILDGVIIGDNTVVAAGSVVTRGEYPNNCLIAGVPAKIKGYL